MIIVFSGSLVPPFCAETKRLTPVALVALITTEAVFFGCLLAKSQIATSLLNCEL